jgi:DNA sulfur modification protein DndB
MTNKVLIPAFKAHVGDWEYYICIMKYAQVAKAVSFAHELRGNTDINEVVQRGLSVRTEQIKQYLLTSEHRFLGALIVAAYGGNPNYVPVGMEDPDGMLAGLDSQFGVLTFDGGESYFALDGQHRLKAIKDAVKMKPELGKDEIAVIVVAHFDTEEGKRRTRRLFTNINRNAKSTTASENILLDEDDGAAIITRRLVTDHPILSRDGFVKIFTRINNDEGEMKLAGTNIPVTDPKAFTTIGVLYDMVKYLSYDLPVSIRAQAARPTDEELEQAYVKISARFDKFFSTYSTISNALASGPVARDLRAPKEAPGLGHPLMRPVIQKSVTRVIEQICDQHVMGLEDILKVLGGLPDHIQSAPWNAVFNATTGKMISNADNTSLLDKLLYIHIAPPSKEEVKRVRKLYKDLKTENYPVSEEMLNENIKPHEVKPSTTTGISDTLSTGHDE